MGLEPELAGDADRLNAFPRPPLHFLAGLVQFAVMGATQRDREFITDLQPQAARLREAQMMRIAGLPAAHETGLLGYELKVRLVAQPTRQRKAKQALVNPADWFLGGLPGMGRFAGLPIRSALRFQELTDCIGHSWDPSIFKRHSKGG